MGEIVLGTREHNLGVARDLDLPRPVAAIGDRQPANLHVVFRGHDDLELRFEVAVASPEGRFLEFEDGLVLVGLAADRLVGRRPDLTRPRIAEVDEVRARVRRAVVAPTRDREAPPAARAAAGVRERGRVSAVRQEMRMRAAWCAASENAATGRGRRSRPPCAPSAGRASDSIASRGTRSCSSSSVAFTRGSAWNRVTKTSSSSMLAMRHQRHALMMGKEGPYDLGLRRARRLSGVDRGSARPVVDRFVEAESAVEPLPGQCDEVRHRGRRIDQAGERGRIRRHDEVVGEPSLESQAGDAERLVLIVAEPVRERVRRLRNAPGNAALSGRTRSAGARSRGSSDRAACRDNCAAAAAASGTRTSSRPTRGASRCHRRW